MSLEHWSDILAFWYTSIVSAIGIVASSLLIHIMQTSTNPKLFGYLYMLRKVAFFNLLSSIVSFMTTTRILFVDESSIYIFQGPIIFFFGDGFLGRLLCYYCYTSERHIFLILQSLLIYNYFYRYLLLTDSATKTSSVRKACRFSTIAVVVFYHVEFFFFSFTGTEVDIDEISRTGLQNLVYVGLDRHNAIFYNLSEKLNNILPFIVVFVAAVSDFVINKKLGSSTMVPRLHRSFLNALHLQTIFPILHILAFFTVYLCDEVLGVETPILENFIQIPMVTMSAVTPIIIFNSINSYKKALHKLLKDVVQPPVPSSDDDDDSHVIEY